MGFSNNTPIQSIQIGNSASSTTDAVKFHSLAQDTYGNHHPSLVAEYALSIENPPVNEELGAYLTFRFRAAHPFDASPDTECGVFTANLWQRDCSEFFLCNPATGRYLEFNLNPNGAWWSASFNAPRVHRRDEPFGGVRCSVESTTDKQPIPGVKIWSVAISIPIESLEAVLETSITKLTANITAILSTPNQIFLTATPLGGEEPDFHRPTDWLPVSVADRSS